MHRLLRPDGLDLESAESHASPTHPHDRASMSPSFSMMSVPVVNPEPAYIAASAASQIVTADYQQHYGELFEGNEHTTGRETALVSPSSLSLVNAFLDRLLFNFLASAQSTSLSALKPAIVEVLKPRLAKEAIDGAEEELREFLEGGDDAEFESHRHRQEQQDAWDLEMVWKRTRLRCMVYTRLGDMEEEDEEMYIAQEHLEDSTTSRRLSRDFGIVSPPVAIFLTSVLECIGEMALGIAGEAAYKRMDQRLRMEKQKPAGPQRLIVQEMDMEKVALNATLGRLWRSWRKLLRSPRTSISRVLSRDSGGYRGLRGFSSTTSGSRRSSIATSDGALYPGDLDRTPSVAEVLSGSEPASIPLPSTDYDVAEIEVPGYSVNAIPRFRELAQGGSSNRPYSMMIPMQQDNRPPTPVSSHTFSPSSKQNEISFSGDDYEAPRKHQRSHSLPTPINSPYVIAPEYQESTIESRTVKEQPENADVTPDPPVREDDLTPRAENLDSKTTMSNSMADRLAGRANPISPPVTPFQGSVLNAISRHAARELTPPNTSPEGDNPTIENVESALSQSEGSIGEPKLQDSNRLSATDADRLREAQQTRYSSASSNHDDFGGGDVSPMEPAPVESGEVSPIDPSEDNRPGFYYRYQDRDEPLTSNDTHNRAVAEDFSRDDRMVSRNVGNVHISPRSMQGRQRGMEGPTEDDYAKEEKREAFVVLEDVPAVGSVRNSDASTLSGKDLQPDGTISTKRSRPTGVENAPLSLTPLREMMEHAPATPDESSSFTASQAHSSPHAARTSLSSSVHSHTKNSSTGSKGSDLRRQLPAVYTGANHDRAVVQPASFSPIRTRDNSISQGRSSESSSREIRPTYVATTSAPSPSSAKRRGHLVSISGDNLGPSRSSSGGSKSTHDERYNKDSAQLDDTQRSFERLINSEETIQYTLTPHTMRELEGPDSQRNEPSYTTSKASPIASKVRSGRTSMEQNPPTPGRSVMGSIKGINGLRSSPVTTSRSRSSSDHTQVATSKGQSLVIHSGPTVKRGPQPIARDARIENETTRDFADFIRSTGPESLKSLPKLPGASTSRPTTAVNASQRSPTNPQPISPRTVGKTANGLNPIIPPQKAENKTPKKSGPRLQARDAAINRNDQSSDLIDFIRQGPQIDRSDRNEGAHRIPRTIAPFRTTMDSDEIQALGHGNARSKDAISTASTQDSSFMSKSLRSSVNSRTGLLESSNRNNTKIGIPPTEKHRADRFDDPPEPRRKQRRVRDPYAIDTDSEEEDHDTVTPKAPREESLMDFLNSVPPPTANFDPVPFDVPKSYQKTLQRKTSGPSMRSRFTRSASTTANQKPDPRSPPPARSSTPPAIRGRSVSGPQKVSNHRPRNSSPHLVQQPGGKFDTYRPTQPTYAPHRAKKPAARDEHEVQKMDMTDLADFLKNSGPPEPPGGFAAEAPVVGVAREEKNFRGIFSRRKRVGAA